jgi:hypothetical protein
MCTQYLHHIHPLPPPLFPLVPITLGRTILFSDFVSDYFNLNWPPQLISYQLRMIFVSKIFVLKPEPRISIMSKIILSIIGGFFC